MKAADQLYLDKPMTDQEKGIIFGIALGTVLSFFLSPLFRSIQEPTGVAHRVSQSRQPTYHGPIR